MAAVIVPSTIESFEKSLHFFVSNDNSVSATWIFCIKHTGAKLITTTRTLPKVRVMRN